MATLTLTPSTATITAGGALNDPAFTATDDLGNPIANPTVTGPVPAFDSSVSGTYVYTLTTANADVAADVTATYSVTVNPVAINSLGQDFIDGDKLRDATDVTGSEYAKMVAAENADVTVTTEDKAAAYFDEQALDPYEVAGANKFK